jgi:hypothetical protein
MLSKGRDCPPKLVQQSDRLEKTIKINMLFFARQGGQKNVAYCALQGTFCFFLHKFLSVEVCQ